MPRSASDIKSLSLNYLFANIKMRRCFNYRTIRQLMLFAAVTQEKSFRRAAKRLNMSVPPLVLQIDELEARLKMKLLERTPRGVSPTAQGNAIMPMID